MKTIIQSIGFSFIIAMLVSLSGCNPEGIKPTPGNYIIQGDEDTGPAFSPDGNFIAYLHDDAGTNSATSYATGLYIIDRNGLNRKLVLPGVHLVPAWSPDGNWLVFSSLGTLQKCKTNGSELTTFTGLTQLKYREFYYPDWTYDGRIVFDNPFPSDGGGIFQTVFDFTSSGVLVGADSNGRIGRDPELSKNGLQIIFLKGAPEGNNWEVYKLDFSGQIETRLTQNNRDDRAPTWSYDGKKIAWSSNIRLTIMNADGSDQFEIGFGNSPSWSVNNEIVFSHANADYTKEVLYTISPDGKNKRQITF